MAPTIYHSISNSRESERRATGLLFLVSIDE